MRAVLWGLYALFLGLAIYTGWEADLLRFEGATGIAKAALIAIWLAFLAYSIECSRRENFFRSVGHMLKTYWGRQVGIDLYISMALSMGVVFLVSGSWAVTLLWALPVLFYANLAFLVFVILHLEELVAALSGALS